MNSMAPFTISVTRDRDHTICSLGGRMTHASYELFRPVLDMVQDGGNGPFVLDLEKLHFVDSNGLGMLLVLSETARERGRPVRLVNIPPRVERLLHQTNTHQLFVQ